MLTHIESGLRDIFTESAEYDGAVLRLDDVSVRFGGVQALSKVTCEVDQHDVVAIVGPNGAGKSTLLNAVGNLVRSTGRIRFFERDIHGVPPARIAHGGIGRSFQDPQLVDEYTVLENVMCGAHLKLGYGLADQVFRPWIVSRAERETAQKAQVLLEFVDLDGVANHEAGSLSYGARKRTDIARAMLSGPRLLLLDEPSSGLDSAERASLQATLLALREQRLVTAIIVEHHMDLVRSVANQVLGMQAGEVLLSGTPSEVLDSEMFREAIVGGGHHNATPEED
jgi:ABC-type branched-subunit amino acid transport system ATPase component